jgi:hypothetical protein
LVIAKTRFDTKNDVCQALAGIGVNIEELRIEDFDLSGLGDLYNGLDTIRRHHNLDEPDQDMTKH